MSELCDRIIERLIRAIPSHNPGYVSSVPETLDQLLSADLLRKIAKVAAAESLAALAEPQSMVEVTVEQIEQALPLEYRKGAKTIVEKLGPLYRQGG